MHQRISEELARQRQADMLRRAAGRECRSPARPLPPGPAVLAARTAPARTRPARRQGAASARHGRHASHSLRTRAGWWLVDVGLKLAVRPDSRPAASPRPAGS